MLNKLEKNLVGKKEIQQTLVYCAIMVGLKPDKIEIEIAEKFILMNYPRITINDLIKSFQLNSSGKYWNIIEPFGSFNTIFIGKILLNYNHHINKEKYNKIKQLEPPLKKSITHAEAKPMLDKMRNELKKINLKFNLKNK